MRITMVCFGAMRDHLPADASGNRAELELPEGATVEDAVDALGAPRELVFSLLVDGTHAHLDHVLGEGSEVTLMPPFAGGTL